MSKTVLGAILMGIAVPIGFGACAVFAATYGSASATVLTIIALALVLCLTLFIGGIGLIVLGLSQKRN